MNIFAVSDLHMSTGIPNKEMDIFGAHWQGHFEKIRLSWLANVDEQDIVIVAGDLSWGINYDEADPDLEKICALPGKKVLIRGNHDFWHASLTKTRSKLTNNTWFLQNDAVQIGDYTFAGARGWRQRTDPKFTAEDEKIYLREIERLKMSLNTAKKLGGEIIGIMHYPPFAAGKTETEFTKLFSEAGVKTVVFGHIHGNAELFSEYTDCEIDGTKYILTSCDYQNFKIAKIL